MADIGKSKPIAGQVHGRPLATPGALAKKLEARVAAMFSSSLKPRAGERPTTMPRDQAGQHINPGRRAANKVKAAYQDEHGRRMNAKAWKRYVRAQANVGAMVTPKGGST